MKRTIPNLLVALTLLTALFLNKPASSQEADPDAGAQKPNIIVIVADDISHQYLGCYGGSTPTPNLDKLASEGVRFANAQAVTPLCNPSRYTLLAGQFPGRNPRALRDFPEDTQYWIGQTTDWTEEDPSIARVMNAAGYFTGYVGKWHSNFEAIVEDIGLENKLDPKNNTQDNARLVELHSWRTEQLAKLTGFDRVLNLQVGNLAADRAVEPALGYHNPEFQTLGAITFLEEAAEKGQPFFLHLANSIPHGPDNLKSLEQDAKVTHAGMQRESVVAQSGHPARETVWDRLREADLNIQGPIASINGGTIVLDDQLGVIREKLEELGLAGNTAIIWLGDHSIYGKGTAYTPGTHVPMIAMWPKGIPADGVVETPVSLVDVFPTCAEIATAQLPDDQIDGTSFLALAQGLTETHPLPYQEIGWFRGIVEGHYHFITFRPPRDVVDKMKNGEIDFAADAPKERRDYQGTFGNLNLPFKPAYFEPDQLYDLRVDPFERNNLANDPAYADVVAKMKDKLATITETFERPYPMEAPEFLHTPEFAELVVKRKKIAEEQTHYPEPYDAELIYNLNLLDPPALMERIKSGQ